MEARFPNQMNKTDEQIETTASNSSEIIENKDNTGGMYPELDVLQLGPEETIDFDFIQDDAINQYIDWEQAPQISSEETLQQQNRARYLTELKQINDAMNQPINLSDIIRIERAEYLESLKQINDAMNKPITWDMLRAVNEENNINPDNTKVARPKKRKQVAVNTVSFFKQQPEQNSSQKRQKEENFEENFNEIHNLPNTLLGIINFDQEPDVETQSPSKSESTIKLL